MHTGTQRYTASLQMKFISHQLIMYALLAYLITVEVVPDSYS